MFFADVLEIKNGKNQRAVEDPEGKYPIYGSGGIMGRAKDYICQANTVIIGRKGNINKPIYVDEPFWNVDTAFGLEADNAILHPRYLYYFCLSYDFEKLNKAVTIPSLTKADLLKIEIDLPEISEQTIIVEKLGKIEQIIALRKEELKKLDELIKARFVEMFVDKGYQIKKVQDVLETAFWLMPATPEFVLDGEVPYITSKNIKNGKIDFDNVKYISKESYYSISSNRPTQIGDILVSMIGTLGQTAVIADNRLFYGQNLYLLRLDDSIIDTDYFCEFFNSDLTQHELKGQRNQSTQAYLKANHVEGLNIPIPPIVMQREFSTFVQQVDKSKAVVQKALDEAQLLFDSLMQKYFG